MLHPGQHVGQAFAQVPEHDLQFGVAVEDAAQHETHGVRGRLVEEGPGRASELGVALDGPLLAWKRFARMSTQ